MENSDIKAKELRNRAETEGDFINSKKYNYSLSEYLEARSKDKKEREAPENIIAYFLCMTPQEVKEIYLNIVKKARRSMNIDL